MIHKMNSIMGSAIARIRGFNKNKFFRDSDHVSLTISAGHSKYYAVHYFGDSIDRKLKVIEFEEKKYQSDALRFKTKCRGYLIK